MKNSCDDYNKEFDTFHKVGTAVSLGGLLIGGIGRGIAKRNQKKAEEIYNSARKEYMSTYYSLRENTRITKETITNVVCLKKKIMCSYMKKFLKVYKRLSPQIRFQDSKGLGELRRFVFGQEKFYEVQMSMEAYQAFDKKHLGDDAANVALLMVQDGTVSNLAYSIRDVINAGKTEDEELKRRKMDDVKVQSIDAIARFSVVAVEFGFSGISDAFSAGQQVEEAKRVASEYKYQKEVLEINISKMNAIEQYANMHLMLLNRFIPLLDEYVNRAGQIIRKKDSFFHLGRIQEDKFPQDELEVLAFTFSLVGAVKAVVDSPIISQTGEVFNDDTSCFDRIYDNIDVFEQKCLEMRG